MKTWFVFLALSINYCLFGQNTITGVLIDKKTLLPLTGATVMLPDINKGTVTDTTGMFMFYNVPNGKLKVLYSFVGYKSKLKTIDIKFCSCFLSDTLEPDAFELQEVVISGGSYSMQHENAIKVEQVQLSENTVNSVSYLDKIASIPGVDVISKGPGVAKPVIRGLSQTNILVLNNGIRMENFQFSENHPYMIDEFGIDKVEIIKGPASLLYGSDAIGGVINFIDERVAFVNTLSADYTQQYHTNTNGYVANTGVKMAKNNYNAGIRIGLKSHTDYTDGNNEFVPNSRFNEKSVKANAGITKSFGSFRIFYQYDEKKLGMTVDPAIPLIQKNGRENKIWYQDLDNHFVASKGKFFLNRYKIDLNLSYQLNWRKLQTSEIMPSFEMVNMKLGTANYEAKIYFPPSDKNELIAGSQGMMQTNSNGNAPEHVIPNASIGEISFFGLYTYKDIKNINLQTGGRYDYRKIKTDEEPGKPEVNKQYGNISGSLGGTWNIFETLLIRGNLATAYRIPNIAELTQNGIHGAYYEQGDPGLKPQRSMEGDISMHYHGKKLMFDFATYYNLISEYIYLARTTDTIETGQAVYRYKQTDASIRGWESGIVVMPFEWINIKSTFSHTLAQQKNGDYLPFIPQDKIRLTAILRKTELKFFLNNSFSAGFLYAFKQNHTGQFESETAGYYLLNMQISTTLKFKSMPVLLNINVDNLLNESYTDHLSTLKDVGYYNIGRSITFGIRFNFAYKL